MIDKQCAAEIVRIIEDCEAVQDSDESTYRKQIEKELAYDEIKALVMGGDGE